MKYATTYRTRKQAINAARRALERRKQNYVYGERGGRIPLGQARISAKKFGNVWIPIGRRK